MMVTTSELVVISTDESISIGISISARWIFTSRRASLWLGVLTMIE